jgi:putative protein-disulfide isomerase
VSEEFPRELVYAFDPLSEWCYAFRPEIAHISSTFEHLLPIRIACGGLIAGARERPVREDTERIEFEMGEVLRRSGIGFGKAFVQNILQEGSWVRRSEPACRAVLIAQEMDRSRALDFANRLCHASFWAGMRPDVPETISRLATASGYDAAALLKRWFESDASDRTFRAFSEARRHGVETYPSLFLQDGDEWRPICRGYVRAREAIGGIRAELERLTSGSSSVA